MQNYLRKPGFKRTIRWNKYQSKITNQAQNQHLDYSIDLNFLGVNRLFDLSYRNIGHRLSYKQYFLPTIEIKDYNVMINGKKFFDQLVKNYLRINDNIQKLKLVQAMIVQIAIY